MTADLGIMACVLAALVAMAWWCWKTERPLCPKCQVRMRETARIGERRFVECPAGCFKTVIG